MNLFTILAEESSVGTTNQGQVALGFQLPNFTQVLTFVLRFFFVIAGLVALIYLLLGALAWITSGGNKENVEKAQQKIQAAIIGIIVIFLVLALVGLIENIFFPGNCGIGIFKELCMPELIQ